MTAALLALDAQLLDLATFILVAQGREVVISRGESNPIMAGMGLDAIVIVKLAGIAALTLLAWRLRARRVALLPGLAGLFGAVSNIWALL